MPDIVSHLVPAPRPPAHVAARVAPAPVTAHWSFDARASAYEARSRLGHASRARVSLRAVRPVARRAGVVAYK